MRVWTACARSHGPTLYKRAECQRVVETKVLQQTWDVAVTVDDDSNDTSESEPSLCEVLPYKLSEHGNSYPLILPGNPRDIHYLRIGLGQHG